MKVTRKQIIFIIILSIILIGTIVAYFLTRTKDNYQHKVGIFSSENLAQNRLQIQKYNEFKDKQFLLFKKRVKNLKGPVEDAELEIEKRKLEKEKADKDQKKMLEAVGDATKTLGKNILKDIYGIAKCDLIDKGGEKCISDDVLINLAKDIGIGLLKVGLACAGLGFLGGALDSLFGGGSSAPPTIDYNRIKNIVEQALNAQQMKNFFDSMSLTSKNIQEFIARYMADKQNKTQSLCVDETQEQISKFLKTPNSLNPNLKYDPNTIAKVGTSEGKTKRKYLNDILDGSNLYDLVKNNRLTGVNSLVYVASNDVKIAVELYPIFLNLISYTIIYYQEKATIDLSSITGDGNMDNPWISSYIGQPDYIGRKQEGFSLLAELQDLCIKFFAYLRDIFRKLISKIRHSDEKTSGCDNISGDCVRWGNSYDESNVIPDSFITQWNKLNPPSRGMGRSALVGWGGNRWNPEAQLNNQKYFCWQLNEYMNKPFEALSIMKKMAGIAWLENEISYDYQIGNHTTPNIISYTKDGGYPFGTDKSNYEYAIWHYKNNQKPGARDGENIFWNNYSTGSLCSPIYYGKPKCIKCGLEEKCINIIDKEIINNTLGNKITNKDVYCKKDYGLQSCLSVNKSPGNIDGSINSNSRDLYCVKKIDGIITVEDPKYSTGDSGEFTCDNDISLEKCSYGTPIPLKPYINVNSEEFNIQLNFTNVLPGSHPTKFSPEIYGYFYYNKNKKSTEPINIYNCNYQDKKTYDVTNFFINVFKILDLDSRYIYYAILLDAPILHNPPTTDPGVINNTTRPPINTECKILGYDYINVIKAIWTGTQLVVDVKLRGVKKV